MAYHISFVRLEIYFHPLRHQVQITLEHHLDGMIATYRYNQTLYQQVV